MTHILEDDLEVDWGWVLVQEITAYLWKVARFQELYPELTGPEGRI